MRKHMMFTLATVGVLFMAFASTASASLARVIPDGLPSNPQAAQTTVRQLVDIDSNVRATVAQDIGVNPNDIKVSQIVVVGRQTSCQVGTNGCINTGRDAAGKIHTTNFKNGQVVMAWKFKIVVNSKVYTFKFKGDCSNPLLRRRQAHQPRAKVVKKTITLNVFKKFSRTAEAICPSGQKVTVTAFGSVRGVARGRIWAKIYGTATLRYQQGVELQVSQKIRVICGAAPNVPVTMVPPAPGAPPVIQIIQIGCSVVGNDNDWNNVCSPVVQPPPPVVIIPPPPPPPPPVNQPPTGQLLPPQHVFVNRQASVCVDNVADPDGDQINVDFSFTAGQAISAVFTQPGGAMCVMYQAPATPQQVTVTAVLTDGRGGSLTLLDNFPVIPDQF